MLRALFLTTIYCLLASRGAAFTTRSPWSSSTRPASSSSTLIQLPSTATDEERLTDQEEDLLFGRDDLEQDPSFRKKDKFGNVLPTDHRPASPLEHASDPLINKLHTIRDSIQSCPELWLELEKACPDLRAVLDEHMCDVTVDLTFAEFADTVRRSAAVFKGLGVQAGTHVAILGENSARWLQIDQGLQLAGGVSAVRGADAPLDELRYIYEHSDSAGVVVLQGPKLLQKLMKDSSGGSAPLGLSNQKYGPVKTVLLMHREKATDEDLAKIASEQGIQIQVFTDLLEATAPISDDVRPALTRKDVSTIVYTSGTTGGY